MSRIGSQTAESAIELARCLRDLPTGEAAFASYEGLRRPRVEMISGAAAKTSQAKAARQPRAAACRPRSRCSRRYAST